MSNLLSNEILRDAHSRDCACVGTIPFPCDCKVPAEIERLQREVELLDGDCALLQGERDMYRQQRADWKAVADSRAAHEPSAVPDAAQILNDLMAWSSDAEDDERNNNGSSIVSSKALRELCFRAHAALQRVSVPPAARRFPRNTDPQQRGWVIAPSFLFAVKAEQDKVPEGFDIDAEQIEEILLALEKVGDAETKEAGR